MIGFYPGDPTKLSKEASRRALQECATAIANDGGDMTEAWRNAKLLNPGLVQRAEFRVGESYETSPGQVEYQPGATIDHTAGRSSSDRRSLSAPAPFRVAIPNDDALKALGLPSDASYEEFCAADKANAGADPRDSFSILQALISLLASKGSTRETAVKAARSRFPTLASEVPQEPPKVTV